MTALEVDWRRFVTEQMSSFCLWEINAVRTHSKLPVTTNFMDFFKGLDYHRLQRILDIVSWDSYPQWHAQKDEVPAAVRGISGPPYDAGDEKTAVFADGKCAVRG